MQKIIIVQKFFLVYLAEVMIGTGAHLLLGAIGVSCLKSLNLS